MRSFQDIPIKRKLMVIIMVTTAAALLLSGIGIMLSDWVYFRGISAARSDRTCQYRCRQQHGCPFI